MRRRLSDNICIASVLMMLAMFFSACRRSEVQQTTVSVPREQIAVLITDTVSTLISDSGITRYRIEAPQWLIYDQTEPPYQEFPKGIYLEQFEKAQHWRLTGNVHALNRKGEQFDTPELNWDQQTHRIYSDSVIHITREKSIIEGVGFDSNEEMSKYTILHPTGVFPIEDE